MIIKLNGKEQNVSESPTISNLLEELGYKNSFVAVAINQSCVPRSQFSSTTVQNNDEVEVLAPMSGG